MFYRTRVTAEQSFTLWEFGLSTFFAAVTLNLARWPSYWPWPSNLTNIAWRYTGCANMNFPGQGFRKLAYNTVRETRPKLNNMPLRKWWSITYDRLDSEDTWCTTYPKSPRVSAMMTAISDWWQKSAMRCCSVSEESVNTTTCNVTTSITTHTQQHRYVSTTSVTSPPTVSKHCTKTIQYAT